MIQSGLATALAPAFLAGCAIFPSAKTANVTGPAAVAPAGETSDLARQARRDVEQLQRLSASGGPSGGPSGGSPAASTDSPPGPPEIEASL